MQKKQERWRAYCGLGALIVVCGLTPLVLRARAGAVITATQTKATKSPQLVTPTRLSLRKAGRAAPQFALALPGYRYAFPRDHGSHESYATEWWYYTGHLQGSGGQRFGYQVTLFRVALAPQTPPRASHWATRDVYFGHLALTDASGGRYLFCDRISRGALGLAGADRAGTSQPRVFLGSWQVRFSGTQGQIQTVQASGKSQDGTPFGVALKLSSSLAPTLQGENGVSQKSAGLGHASHYYSYCRLASSGSVMVGNQKLSVDGLSWFDHEFGSNQLAANQVGWDWFSLQLNDGRALMLYRMRRKDGSDDPYSSGTLVDANGRARHLKLADFAIRATKTWRSPHSGATYPVRWTLTLPREGLSLDVSPALNDQELQTTRSSGVTYWEGACDVAGTQNGRPLRGQAYVELTGYARAFAGTF